MTTYRFPSDINTSHLRADASRRRQALISGGCATYVIGSRGGAAAIVCLSCGLGSANANDIREKYCGFCQAWHSEWNEEEVPDAAEKPSSAGEGEG